MLGLVHVYTGDGKGKTTAALGQAFRSAGCGLSVKMIQFLKDTPSGELAFSEKLGDCFRIYRFHEGNKGFFWNMNEEQKKQFAQEVKKGFVFAQECIKDNACDLLILDEIFGCITNRLIKEEELIELIQSKPGPMELILTGRNAPCPVTELADYVSEIRAVKHPMDRGMSARKGIEF